MRRGKNIDETYARLDLSAGEADTAVSANAVSQTIDVVAPAKLQEGHIFDYQVEEGGRVHRVTAPAGGVEKGEKFTFELHYEDYYDDEDNSGNKVGISAHIVSIPRVSVPVGHWKDGLCACCKFGCFHPMLLNTCFFPTILIAQVMTRLNLNFVGKQTTAPHAKKTFATIFIITMIFWINTGLVRFAMVWMEASVDGYAYTGAYKFTSALFVILVLSFFLYSSFIMARTRAHMRSSYAIPQNCCKMIGCAGGLFGDCCMVICCRACIVAQMARHTTNYEMYQGICCSTTGLEDHVPAIV